MDNESARFILENSNELRGLEGRLDSRKARTFDELISQDWRDTLAKYRRRLKHKRYVDRAVWFCLGGVAGSFGLLSVLLLIGRWPGG